MSQEQHIKRSVMTKLKWQAPPKITFFRTKDGGAYRMPIKLKKPILKTKKHHRPAFWHQKGKLALCH